MTTDEIDQMLNDVIAAHVAAYHPGQPCPPLGPNRSGPDRCAVRFKDVPTPAVPPYTREQARALNLPAWNVRCNRCGSYGAIWVPNERPHWHWGNLALCPPHRHELAAEHTRHKLALADLRRVNYEQEQR